MTKTMLKMLPSSFARTLSELCLVKQRRLDEEFMLWIEIFLPSPLLITSVFRSHRRCWRLYKLIHKSCSACWPSACSFFPKTFNVWQIWRSSQMSSLICCPNVETFLYVCVEMKAVSQPAQLCSASLSAPLQTKSLPTWIWVMNCKNFLLPFVCNWKH